MDHASDLSASWRRRLQPWVERPIRWFGLAALATTTACAFCVETTIHPAAEEHTSFCAQYLADGKLTEAESRCRIAIEYSPKYAEPYNLLGLVEYHRGHKQNAVDYFKQALSLKNDFAEAHNNLGVIFLEDQDYAMACDQFHQATEIDPGYVDARRNLAVCYVHDKEPKLARAEYLKCVELDPNACDCRLGLGVLATDEKDYGAGLAHFEKLTEVCPQMAEGHYYTCWTHYQMGKCREAVPACIHAQAVKPDYLEPRTLLTEAYACVFKQDGAVQQYLELIRKEPGNAEPHFNLGALYFERNLIEEAFNEFLNTVQLDPKYLLAYYWAARSADRLLKTDETIVYCQRFVDLLRDEPLKDEKAWCVQRVKELQFE